MIHSYGTLPISLGEFKIEHNESMLYQYMPIKIAGNTRYVLPQRLEKFRALIIAVLQDLLCGGIDERSLYTRSLYIYITAKHGYIGPGNAGNRPGYHSDGFMTDDLNYIWYDKNPTIFNRGTFNVSADDKQSLIEFERQAQSKNEVMLPCYQLLKLDQYCIHKVAIPKVGMWRTFIKISVSKDKYDLIGNTHNHLIDYNWKMRDRDTERNIPQKVY